MVVRKLNIFIAVLLGVIVIASSTPVNAEGLNGLDTSVEVEPSQGNPVSGKQTEGESNEEPSNADAIGTLYENIGVDAESAEKANQYLHPFVTIANLFFALILGISTIAMFLITALDLLYIAVPPVRSLLYQEEQSIMQSPMGTGGQGDMQQPQAKPKLVSRLISDEALAAVAHLRGASQPQPVMSGMSGIGTFGMQQQEPKKMKSVLFDYVKKRSFFLITFGFCAVLLSTTIFTDLGVTVGMWIMNRLVGIESNILE